MQAKYYPETSPNYTEIYRELLYDYLLCDLEGIEVGVYLAIHKKRMVKKQDYSTVKEYIEGKIAKDEEVASTDVSKENNIKTEKKENNTKTNQVQTKYKFSISYNDIYKRANKYNHEYEIDISPLLQSTNYSEDDNKAIVEKLDKMLSKFDNLKSELHEIADASKHQADYLKDIKSKLK